VSTDPGRAPGAVRARRSRRGAVVVAAIALALCGVLAGARQWSAGASRAAPPSAAAEVAVLRADPGLAVPPPGTVVVSERERATCSDRADGHGPGLSLRYRGAGTPDQLLDAWRSALVADGWRATGDFRTGNTGARTINLSRSFATFDAMVIVSGNTLTAELTRPAFC